MVMGSSLGGRRLSVLAFVGLYVSQTHSLLIESQALNRNGFFNQRVWSSSKSLRRRMLTDTGASSLHHNDSNRSHQRRRMARLSQSKTDIQSNQDISLGSVQVLSKDPLVYVVPDLLSKEECDAYQQRVHNVKASRPMTRSNPPEVSLDTSRLWPLPLLSLGAGIPPLIKLFQEDASSGADEISPFSILATMLPNVAVALTASLILAFAVVLPLIRMQSASSSRTSEAIAMNLEQDMDFCRPLVDRVCQVTGHPWYAWEAPVITRYDPGAIFAKHGDASPTKGSEWKDMGGQRVVTCICYLNNVPTGGGETYFDRLDLAVAPETGKALFFFPADAATYKADDRTTHESLPPTEEKWIVQLFGRAERVPEPLGLPVAYDTLR